MLPLSTSEERLSGYHHGNLRQALIDGAKDLIAEAGPDGFSLRALARRVGVSHTAAYRHFADKEALLAAVAQEGFEGLNAAFDAAVADACDPFEAFRASGIAYVRYAVEHPSNFRVMFRMADRAEAHPELSEAGQAAYQRLLDSLAAAQEAGGVRPGPVEPLALVAWSTVHGLARLIVDGALTEDQLGDAEVVADHVIAVLTEGLGAAQG